VVTTLAGPLARTVPSDWPSREAANPASADRPRDAYRRHGAVQRRTDRQGTMDASPAKGYGVSVRASTATRAATASTCATRGSIGAVDWSPRLPSCRRYATPGTSR